MSVISLREPTIDRGQSRFTSRQLVLLWARATLGLLCGASAVCAQPRTREVSQYVHTSWTSQAGSVRGDIRSIAQTSDGYLSLAWSTGDLLRFDGVRFAERKPPNDGPLLPKRTNLPPGEYRFRVIASNDAGVWNTTGDSRSIVIPPAFYQTIWFRCLVAAAAAALLWSLYWWRLTQATAQVHARLLAQMEERERIARELHDTLLQGFQGITLRIQGISKQMPAEDRPRQLIEEVLDRADEVLRDARYRVRTLRQRATDANDLGDRLQTCGQELSKDHAVTFTLAIVGEPRVLEPTVQDEAYRIMREALTNAFRHASASTVETEITYTSGALRMRVRDDGVGIAKAVLVNGQPSHWGLTSMREGARTIRAELHLWSRETAGTEVELVIPTSIAYPREELNAR